MIDAIMLLFAATVGALIGIFCVTATASGEKYDGEMYEHDRQILMRRINRLEREIKAIRGQSKDTGGDRPCGT